MAGRRMTRQRLQMFLIQGFNGTTKGSQARGRWAILEYGLKRGILITRSGCDRQRDRDLAVGRWATGCRRQDARPKGRHAGLTLRLFLPG